MSRTSNNSQKAQARRQALITAALCLTISACGGGNGAGLDAKGRPLGEQAGQQVNQSGGGSDRVDAGTANALDTIQRTIFTPECATSGCHSGTASPLGLNLAEGQAWSHLVGKPSNQASGLQLVEPSNADASYLLHKLMGTQDGGQQMPLGRPPLSEANIALVREWILDGAPATPAEGQSTGGTGNTDGTEGSGDGGSGTNGGNTQGETGNGATTGAGTTTDPINDEPTLSNIQNRIFDARCDGCHVSASASGSLNLADGMSYSQLVGRASEDGTAVLVQPGSAGDSLLIDKLTGENLGTSGQPGYRGLRMPVVGGYLSAEDVDLVRRWIDAAALDN